MRCATASQFSKRKTRKSALQPMPRENTRVREVYDFFYANKGQPVIYNGSSRDGSNTTIDRLRDFYGLDLRSIKRGTWVLAGEWFGKVYVDYIAEHVVSPDKRRAA